MLNYEGRHSRDYKTLEFKIVLKQDPPPGFVVDKISRPMGDAFEATIHFDGCLGKTPREALVRLAQWCRRASVAIHQFNPQVQVPG